MEPKAIYTHLQNRFGEAILSFEEPTPVPIGRKDTPEEIERKKAFDEKRKLEDAFGLAKATSIMEIARFLRDDPELKMDFLMCISGVDTKEQLQVVYHFFSYPLRHKFILKVEIPRDEAKVDSLTELYPVAELQEREAYDLYGIDFSGHPDLRRILLPDEWPGHPMRKDWKEPEELLGIATTRENPLDMLGAFNQYKAEQEAKAKEEAKNGEDKSFVDEEHPVEASASEEKAVAPKVEEQPAKEEKAKPEAPADVKTEEKAAAAPKTEEKAVSAPKTEEKVAAPSIKPQDPDEKKPSSTPEESVVEETFKEEKQAKEEKPVQNIETEQAKESSSPKSEENEDKIEESEEKKDTAKNPDGETIH